MDTQRNGTPGIDGRLAAENNELSLLRLLRTFGHLRRSEVARALWPRSGGSSSSNMAYRTVARMLRKGLVIERPNSLGGSSLVLAARGASRLRDMGIDAQDGLDLSSVSGPQCFHRTLGTCYLIERGVQGHKPYGEYALAKGYSPVSRAELSERFKKVPDGLVTLPGSARGFDDTVSAVDWIEVESSFKPTEELERILAIAWRAGSFLDGDGKLVLDRVVFVFDARSRHQSAILNALERYLRRHPLPLECAVLSSIALTRCELTFPLVFRNCSELTASDLLVAPQKSAGCS